VLQLRRPLGHRAGGALAWPRGEPITEASLDAAMALAHVPDPDLIIRTGGEQRISNFLLWQAAYSELYFSDTLWPDFDEAALDEAIAAFAA
jgi:undecaprenyl diphosphate synthase